MTDNSHDMPYFLRIIRTVLKSATFLNMIGYCDKRFRNLSHAYAASEGLDKPAHLGRLYRAISANTAKYGGICWLEMLSANVMGESFQD